MNGDFFYSEAVVKMKLGRENDKIKPFGLFIAVEKAVQRA